MLLQFKVTNYKSFRDETELNMLAAKGEKDFPENCIPEVPGSKGDVLKFAAIYGANASGKSNLIHAMKHMRELVISTHPRDSTYKENSIPPFALDKRLVSEPTIFEVTIMVGGVRYQYGFSFKEGIILEEWLISYPHGRPRTLFEREWSEGDYPTVHLGTHWGDKSEWAKLVKFTRHDKLFLATASDFNHSTAISLTTWFRRFWNFVQGQMNAQELESHISAFIDSNPRSREFTSTLLNQTDTGVEKIRVIKNSPQPSDESARTAIHAPHGEIRFVHSGLDENGNPSEIDLPYDVESGGTRKIFELSWSLRHTLNLGGLLVIDELDSRLHPNMTKELIRLFANESINPHGAQLIFATHDSSLLEKDLFRRDQVWFTEKDDDGASVLYSLWDFKPRKNHSIRRGYLNGRYGAIPFIGDLAEHLVVQDEPQ